ARPRRCLQSICRKRSTPSMNYLAVETRKQCAMPFSVSFASANDANDSRPQMMYERFLRPLLFALDPETAHHFALAFLRAAGSFVIPSKTRSLIGSVLIMTAQRQLLIVLRNCAAAVAGPAFRWGLILENHAVRR